MGGMDLPKSCVRRCWFPENSAVIIKELQKAAQLNGQRATIMAWDEEKERYEVMLDGTEERKTLKADNLEVAPIDPFGKGKSAGKGKGMMGMDMGMSLGMV